MSFLALAFFVAGGAFEMNRTLLKINKIIVPQSFGLKFPNKFTFVVDKVIIKYRKSQ